MSPENHCACTRIYIYIYGRYKTLKWACASWKGSSELGDIYIYILSSQTNTTQGSGELCCWLLRPRIFAVFRAHAKNGAEDDESQGGRSLVWSFRMSKRST